MGANEQFSFDGTVAAGTNMSNRVVLPIDAKEALEWIANKNEETYALSPATNEVIELVPSHPDGMTAVDMERLVRQAAEMNQKIDALTADLKNIGKIAAKLGLDQDGQSLLVTEKGRERATLMLQLSQLEGRLKRAEKVLEERSKAAQPLTRHIGRDFKNPAVRPESSGRAGAGTARFLHQPSDSVPVDSVSFTDSERLEYSLKQLREQYITLDGEIKQLTKDGEAEGNPTQWAKINASLKQKEAQKNEIGRTIADMVKKKPVQ